METSRLPENLRFVILCCKAEPTVEDIEAIRTHVKAAKHLEEVSMLAYEHGVYPLFYLALMKHAADLIDGEMKDAMAYLMQTVKVTNENMTRELLYLNDLLKKEGIEILAFKGPVLAQMAYGSIYARQFLDIDIFCKKEDFKNIAAILRAEGYEPQFSIDKFGDKTLFEFSHDVPFVHKGKNIVLELHFEFFRKELYLPTEAFNPWTDIKKVEILSSSLLTISDESNLLYLTAHGSKHFWEKIEWIVDLDRMIRANPHMDWDILMNDAKKLHIRNIFAASLLLSRGHLDTPLPEEVMKMETNNKVANIVHYFHNIVFGIEKLPEIATITRVHTYTKLRDTLYIRTKTFLASILRPNKSDREIVQFDDRFYFLYWPFRLFKLISRDIFGRGINR